MGQSMQYKVYWDEISKRIKRLMGIVLFSIIISAVMLVFFYLLSILALCEVEFAVELLLAISDKLPIITVINVCSMIVSVLYYASIADLGRYEFGFLVTAMIGFVSFLFNEISPDVTASADKMDLLKACAFEMFISLLFYCYYCDAMKKLLKKMLKRPSECWGELKKSAFLVTGIYAVIIIGLLTIIKVLGNVEKFDSSSYSYSERLAAYEEYSDMVARRNNTIAILVLIALGVIVFATIILRIYEYGCLKYSLPDEIDEEFEENGNANNVTG